METQTTRPLRHRLPWFHIACIIPLLVGSARASIAYGSIHNFETVNDTGHECHGFEIELEDCHITYTYEVKLRNLLSDDAEDPHDKNWRNGEPRWLTHDDPHRRHLTHP